MTEQEAIVELKHLTNRWANDEDMYSPFMKYEVDQKFINAVYVAKSALEKQIPKKLKTKLCEEEIYNAGGFTRKVKRYFCPVCGSFIEHGKHCYNCGQKLDWSEV